jgi:hypothetical protein
MQSTNRNERIEPMHHRIRKKMILTGDFGKVTHKRELLYGEKLEPTHEVRRVARVKLPQEVKDVANQDRREARAKLPQTEEGVWVRWMLHRQKGCIGLTPRLW